MQEHRRKWLERMAFLFRLMLSTPLAEDSRRPDDYISRSRELVRAKGSGSYDFEVTRTRRHAPGDVPVTYADSER
jgi:hypothetical protein